ncbi:isoprenoid synthase domain-containing protein [Cyathus striatus]|nr:isoprenoid synthase domain-containing protein [Cyathus striatus]
MSSVGHVYVRRLFSVTRYVDRSRKYSVLAHKIEPTKRPEPVSNHNPYTLVAPELAVLRGNLLSLLGSAHPGLTEIAEVYFLQPSKQFRSLLVLLFSHATNGLGSRWQHKRWEAQVDAGTGRTEELDRPLKISDVLNEWNPNMLDTTASFESVFRIREAASPITPLSSSFLDANFTPCLVTPPLVLPTQLRLAQIMEMIHVASLLHDGIVKNPESGQEDAIEGFGNKLSILGGDFLLGRASTALSRLGESEVVELVASVISNIVEGEILRMEDVKTPELGAIDAWDVYLRKSYLKSASILAKSARASVVLGGCGEGEIWKELAYAYGRNLGIAYQLIEDVLDYETGPSNIQPGLVAAPAIYAWEEHPELRSAIRRNFTKEGDLELAVHCVSRSSAIERTRLLARAYADKAREALHLLPDSESKTALHTLADMVLTRTW